MNELTTIDDTFPVRATSFNMLDTDHMARMMEAATLMASARVTIPKHLQGSAGDCMAVIMMASQFGINPFSLAQKTHVINGTLGYESQLVNAIVSSSSLLATRIAYEWEGDWKSVNGKTDKDDSHAVIVTATIRGESEPRSLRVSMSQVGDVRNSPLWVSDPRQQLAYLAVKRWARLHAPDVLLGVYSVDELQDAPERAMGQAKVVEQAPALTRTASIKEKLAAKQSQTVTLDQVMQCIDTAIDEAGLHAAGEMAKGLVADEDRKAARSAYKVKRSEMSTAVEQPDPVAE